MHRHAGALVRKDSGTVLDLNGADPPAAAAGAGGRAPKRVRERHHEIDTFPGNAFFGSRRTR